MRVFGSNAIELQRGTPFWYFCHRRSLGREPTHAGFQSAVPRGTESACR